MSPDSPRLGAPLWAYRHPPNDLTNEWQNIYLVLIDPISRICNLSAEHARGGTRDLFKNWHETVQRSVTAANAVLDSIHGRAPRTWRAGHAILSGIAPISAAITVAESYFACPFPTRIGRDEGPDAAARAVRAEVADKLSGFSAVPLLDELAQATVADCAAQRAQVEVTTNRQGRTRQTTTISKRRLGRPPLELSKDERSKIKLNVYERIQSERKNNLDDTAIVTLLTNDRDFAGMCKSAGIAINQSLLDAEKAFRSRPARDRVPAKKRNSGN